MIADDGHLVADSTALQQQVAALCWRKHKGGVQVLLVTSRETGRWVLPKGWPIDRLTDPESAAREAFEEAGVTAKAETACLGRYRYDKVLARGTADQTTIRCEVRVFPIRVRSLRAKFPEVGLRRRKWFDPEKAAGLVAEEPLKQLLLGFGVSVGGAPDAPAQPPPMA